MRHLAEAGGARRWLASGTRLPDRAAQCFWSQVILALGATTLIQAIDMQRMCAQVDAWLTGGRARTGRATRRRFPLEKLPGGRTTGRTAEMNVIDSSDAYAWVCGPGGWRRKSRPDSPSRCEGGGVALLPLPLQVRDRDRLRVCDECLKVKPVEGCISRSLRCCGRRGTDFELIPKWKRRDRLTYYNRL